MSFKDNSESEKFSKQTQGEQKRGSSIQSPVGRERAWEYLLRRKAEGITGRIHKVNERSMNHPAESYIPLCSTGVEETERSREPYKRDVSGFPIKACVSSSSAHCSGLAFVPNEGFWLDRTGSRQDQRNHWKKSQISKYDFSWILLVFYLDFLSYPNLEKMQFFQICIFAISKIGIL